jgi:hypothetical protein
LLIELLPTLSVAGPWPVQVIEMIELLDREHGEAFDTVECVIKPTSAGLLHTDAQKIWTPSRQSGFSRLLVHFADRV